MGGTTTVIFNAFIVSGLFFSYEFLLSYLFQPCFRNSAVRLFLFFFKRTQFYFCCVQNHDGALISQNHRILEAGRDLCGSSSPTPLLKQGLLQQAVCTNDQGTCWRKNQTLNPVVQEINLLRTHP